MPHGRPARVGAPPRRDGDRAGLYLVRRFVGLHGGSVGVEGESGSWVSFWFEIPSAEA